MLTRVCVCVQKLTMCVSMCVSVWCGQLITSRLVWLMKHVAVEIDSRARWSVWMCVCPRLVEVKSSSGNQNWSAALNHSEPRADGTRQLQVKLQRMCLIAALKMALHQFPEDSDNVLQEEAASEALHFGSSQSGSSSQTVKETLKPYLY